MDPGPIIIGPCRESDPTLGVSPLELTITHKYYGSLDTIYNVHVQHDRTVNRDRKIDASYEEITFNRWECNELSHTQSGEYTVKRVILARLMKSI